MALQKYAPSWLLIICCFILLTSCNTATPEKYFDLAVLNSNMLVGFADEGLLRQLESPSVKMNDAGQPVPMQRSEVINSATQFVEEDFRKLKELKEADDAKDILQTSIALYEYVIPVYKTAYVKLAALYDTNSSKEQIQTAAQNIHDKYYSGFNELYTRLINYGKLFAAKHKIKVNWAR